MKILLIIFASILAISFRAEAVLPTITSAQTGNWNNVTTWVGGVVPGGSVHVVIAATHTVTLDLSPTVVNCTVNGTGTLDASSFTLTSTGIFTLASGATFKQGGTFTAIPGVSKAISSSSTYEYYGSQGSVPVATAFGNLTWNSTAPTGGPAGSLTVNGNLSVLKNEFYGAYQANTATHTIGGNVVVDGLGTILAGKENPGAGSVSWNIAGGVTTQNSGTLTAFSGGTSLGADVDFNIGGNFANNGGFDVGTGAGSATLTFNGTSSQTLSGNLVYVQNVIINNNAGVILTSDLEMYGILTLSAGSLNNSTHLILDNGSAIVRNLGSIAATPAFPPGLSIIYTGSVTTGNELPTVATDLGDLTINASGGVTLGASATVNGTLIFSSGKLTLGANNLTLASANPIVGASSSNYIVTNSTGYMIQNVPSSNVTFPIGTASTYNPVILNNTGGTADNYSVRVASSTANTVTPSAVVADQWTINETSPGGSNIVMTLQWNAGEEGGSFTPRSSGEIGKYTGSWTQLATTVSGSGPYTASNNSAITGNFSNTVYGVGLGAALPVELTSFTAIAQNAKVDLAWATANEINNYGFEVERKTMNNWEKIGFVEGHGSTNAPQNYSFTDAAARVGKYSYRLKQIDRDGKFEHHQAVEVTLGITPNTVWLDNNYPNPFNPSTKISFVLGTTGNASLKVFDLLGKEVVTLADGVFIAGEIHAFTFDASKYSSGIYYYQLKSGARSEMKKMLLLK